MRLRAVHTPRARLLWLLFCGCLSLAVAVRAEGDLTWEAQGLEVAAGPTDGHVTGSFVFTNTGSHAVTIKSVKTSCGCTTANLERETYAPGESGAISAEMTIDRAWAGEGTVTKKIYVMAKEGSAQKAQSYVLTFGAVVPLYVEQSVGTLLWEAGQPLTAQTVDFTVRAKEPITLSGASVDSAAFTARLETVETGRRYRLTVTPVSTKDRAVGNVTISSDFPAEAPYSYDVRVGIRPAPPQPGIVERAWTGLLRLIP